MGGKCLPTFHFTGKRVYWHLTSQILVTYYQYIFSLPDLLRMFFDCLYDEDVISEDAFYKWESSKDPAEQNGKGVALKSVTAFFTWLREAEEESEDNWWGRHLGGGNIRRTASFQQNKHSKWVCDQDNMFTPGIFLRYGSETYRHFEFGFQWWKH